MVLAKSRNEILSQSYCRLDKIPDMYIEIYIYFHLQSFIFCRQRALFLLNATTVAAAATVVAAMGASDPCAQKCWQQPTHTYTHTQKNDVNQTRDFFLRCRFFVVLFLDRTLHVVIKHQIIIR